MKRYRLKKYLLLPAIFLAGLFSRAGDTEYIRTYLSVLDGLSQNEVTSITEDKYGFLWFGTRGGLNRYDGYGFKHYKPGHRGKASIPDPSVERLCHDSYGRIWVGTKTGGLCLYDPRMEEFTPGSSFIEHKQDRVVAFYEDSRGRQWIGSVNKGLVMVEKGLDSSVVFFPDRRFSSITETPDGRIWFSTSEGLMSYMDDIGFKAEAARPVHVTEMLNLHGEPYIWMVGWELGLLRYNYRDGSIKEYSLPASTGREYSSYSLLADGMEGLWLGSWGGGLYRFNKAEEKFERFDIYPGPDKGQVLDYDIILDIYRDRGGSIWIGTDGGGVVRLSASGNFNTIVNFPGDIKAHITAVFKEEDCLIAGTRGQGAFYRDGKEDFKEIRIEDQATSGRKQSVYYISKDSLGQKWFGLDRGLYILPPGEKNESQLIRAGNYFNSSELNLPSKVLNIVHRGRELWLGTQQGGLWLFSWNNGSYELVKRFYGTGLAGDIDNKRVSGLFIDRDNRLWAGTYKGLFMYADSDSAFIPLDSKLVAGGEPGCDIILCTWQGMDNDIWFGTPCGLNRLGSDSKGKLYLARFTKEDGLPDDYISNVLQDDEGYIWISSNAGISRLDPSAREFINFSSADGTGNYNFSESAAFISPNGEMYLGGFSGITWFNPYRVNFNSKPPPIVITSFSILNREVPVSAEGLLPVSINEIKKLNLTFREKEVSLEFAALDYKGSGLNQYSYKLAEKGEAGEWIYLGTGRKVSLRNLKPGHYDLLLRGSNSNGVWNEGGRHLEIVMYPPPWKSWYAILIYVFVLLIILILIVRVSLKQERLKSEAELEHMERKKEKEINDYKFRFFTNISHEFRTPLSLIIAPLEELAKRDLSSSGSDVNKKLSIAFKNSERLQKLVGQLLEFRKLEAGKAVLRASEVDVVNLMRDICQPFAELAEQRGVDFKEEYHIGQVRMFLDTRKISVVVNNLLSNAFKYCGKPGRILLEVRDEGSELSIGISNDGKGISRQEQKVIFDRFYQLSSDQYHESSGIGLALVKNYTEMHGGRVEVESEKGEQTRFRLWFKKGKEHLDPADLRPADGTISIREPYLPPDEDFGFYPKGTKGDRILIVEDNREMQDYLEGLLGGYYELQSAYNGEEGFNMIQAFAPDLVISDVMMPEMDGYELCDRIKSHSSYYHIPVILLTAKDTLDDKVFGTKKGADLYITKPFDAELLVERIRQLLEIRSKLSEKYSRKVSLEPTGLEITREDEKLINKARKIVETNIDSDKLNLDFMAGELAMSSTTLYRKMKAVCDMAPGEFIRSTRFKRAAQLLKDTDLTVSEIVEMVGYSDQKRFRESFRQEFDLTPSEYRKKGRKNE